MLTVILLGFAGFFLLRGCVGEQSEVPVPADDAGNTPDQEAWPFSMILSRDGIKTAEVHSGYMAHYPRQDQYELSDSVTVDFYDERGVHTSLLTADDATINEVNNRFTARNNVIVVSDSGITLFTDELQWDNDRQLIYTEQFVTFVTGPDTLYGRGFESDRSLKNYNIYNPTGVTHRVKSDKQ